MEALQHFIGSFMAWHDAQPAIVRFYVDYIIIRSIVMKFVSDETKRWLVQPLWNLCKWLMRRLVIRPLKRSVHRLLNSADSGKEAFPVAPYSGDTFQESSY